MRNVRVEAPRAPRRAVLRALLAERDFRQIWLAGAVVGALRWLELLAVSIYVLEETGSAFTVALLAFVRMAPLFLFGIPAGALADRFDRRTLLLIGLVTLALSAAALATLALLGLVRLWHVAVVAFLNGMFWSAEFPVRRTMLGEIAGLERLGQAMALESATSNATRMLGPALGGLLFEAVGLHGAFFLAAAGYVLGAVLILPVAYRSGSARSPGWTMLGTVLEGWRFIRGQRLVIATLVVTMIVNFWGFAYITMVPVIGERTLGLSAFPIGLLMSAEGFGALLGAFVIGMYSRPRDYTRVYLWSSFGFLVAVLLFALSTWYPLSLGLMLLSGVAIAGFAVMQSTIIFLAAPTEVRSRVMGVLTVSIGAGPLGMLHVGWLADWLDAPSAVAIMTLEGLIALALATLVWPELRRPLDLSAERPTGSA